MIWLAPIALVGLSAVALPVLIHLLGRGRARTQLFPTLRFIGETRLLPTRRTRLHDLLLLAVRAGILATAALALAQPYWATAGRRTAFAKTVARAIIIDTSTRRGQSADSVRALAARLTVDANVSVQLNTVEVRGAIPGALSWLSQQAERRELVVVSEFTLGTIDAHALAAVPTEVGVRLVRAPAVDGLARSDSARTPRQGANTVRTRGSDVPATATTPAATMVEWTVATPTVDASPADTARFAASWLRILSGPSDRSRGEAAVVAASSISADVAPTDTAHAVAIVTPGYDARSALLTAARVPSRAWMVAVLSRLAKDRLLSDAARSAQPIASADSTTALAIARSADGGVIVSGAEATLDGRPTLLLFDAADAGSVTTAALIASVRRAIATPQLDGLDTARIPDSALRAWERAPATQLRATASEAAEVKVGGANAPSDGRWLWMVALVLLAIEAWLRVRVRRDAPAAAIS